MATQKAYDKLVDLFARGTMPQGIVSFSPSAESVARARYLIARQKDGDITPDETAELEQLGAIEHLMQLVKAKARRYVSA